MNSHRIWLLLCAIALFGCAEKKKAGVPSAGVPSDGKIEGTLTINGERHSLKCVYAGWDKEEEELEILLTVTVVRVRDAAGNPLANAFVLANLTGNGLEAPITAAFDGERILVTNRDGNSVSLWKAADLTPLGSFPTGSSPRGACSDGPNFWITLNPVGSPDKLARF